MLSGTNSTKGGDRKTHSSGVVQDRNRHHHKEDLSTGKARFHSVDAGREANNYYHEGNHCSSKDLDPDRVLNFV